MSTLRRAVAAAGGAALLATGLTAVTAASAHAASQAATGGSGASLAYAEVQAENSPTDGSIIGPSYTQGQLADEASGRQAVSLQGTGAYVTFTTPVATNSIDFRYSIPDTSSGSVYTAPLSLYVNGSKQADFTLTNAYSWYYGSYPFTNTPGGNPHHFYDEAHRLFGTTYPAGTTFKLQVDSEDTASSYTIDLADFEDVAGPLSQPSGSVSVTGEGADPTGAADSTSAFNAAIAAAGPGGTVWIPQGTYDIPGHISVNDVTIAGAGMWYSTIAGSAPGFYGNSAPSPSTNVHLQNFAISGNVQERCDSCQVNGIGGALSNSTVSNLWIEHMKVGAWMDGPMTNLTFSGMRIRDTTADGINLHGGVTGSTITDSDIRNTGDDGIALWADSGIGADSQDTISDNTVQLQQLANGIAGYGGNNNTITGNRVVDTGITQGGGITVAQRFSSTPVGLYTVSNNTMIRDGDLDPNWQFGVGALWFDGSQGTVAGPINVSNALIEQSPYEAIQWVEGTINGVSLSNVSIIGTGTFALQEQTGGTASATNVTATGVAQANAGKAPSYSCEGSGFAITDGGGDSGISPTQCNGWPAPVYPPYPASTVQVSPSALDFGSEVTGRTSAAQTVAVSNPTSSAAAVSSISTSGDFAETDNCGSSIAANGGCTVSVTFTPTAAGNRAGTLTVVAGGTTGTVSLSGSGTAAGPILSTTPASLSFSGTLVGSTAASQSVTVTNTGTSSASISGVSVSGDFSQTNNCSALAVDASCTVTVGFAPTAAGSRTGTLTVTGNANNSPTTVGLSGTGIGSTTNLALTGTLTASSSASGYPAGNAGDGNTGTYWESLDGAAYPQTLTANLGKAYPLGSVTLTLPPSSAWATRTETLSVLGSANGTSWTTLVPSAGYTFNPSTGNTVSFNLPANTTDQYLRLSFTGNTGWSAAQISEFEIFPGATSGSTGGGGSGTPTDLALNASISASSYTQTYVPSNADDGNTGTYWESTDGVWPATLTVNLGAADKLTSVVVDLPPSSAWQTRTQTFSILGSTDNANWTTIAASATYTFDPSTGNSVTVNLPSGTSEQYVRLDFTANNVQNGAQVSELEVMGTAA